MAHPVYYCVYRINGVNMLKGLKKSYLTQFRIMIHEGIKLYASKLRELERRILGTILRP
jgi:hypothetical protein